ncbi:dTDP-4-dehydrorhamnose reductase [Runella slithyformis]|uniref:dTDP-4-dehydrorhamnose reductase n=1 Tax=Runella slithyformis (strain ATCC 29530 / DSM 19594 / LMG 11500 / NCIMB 11436 / LSU 4) TaxID=761193 RepID=A0A7U3ZPJ0_RUNSL|nr:dTDP-4-dehydrorhamnose reductase [Runella slithyformis]AEI51002.1 dTDP-4-dehydrorhamnose reductase [Runella slithyformis DSM 19594]
MHTIVLGASGQLGQCLKEVAQRKNVTTIGFPDEREGNILDRAQLERLFEKERPRYVINCAAYTAVDKAEDETDLAAAINRTGAENVAIACRAVGAVLIHISTDFVFEGNRPALLNENDPAEPVSVYGLTKLQGEQAIAGQLPEHFILRTSWLYSEFANNFVKTMLRLGKDREELGVIVDQVGSPTYAIDLAEAILTIISSESTAYGTYHYSNEGAISWYDFAKTIFELAHYSVRVKPLKTSEYPTKARRPAFSVMDKSRIKETLSISVPYWKDSLKACLSVLLPEKN